jgi:hypothetical protein
MDRIMESKHKYKSDNEAKKSCKDVKTIVDKLRGSKSAAAVGITFRGYIFYFKV